jgi:hypothetical protein
MGGGQTCADVQHCFLANFLAQHFAAQNCSARAQRVTDDSADCSAEGLVLGGERNGGDLTAVTPFGEKLRGGERAS